MKSPAISLDNVHHKMFLAIGFAAPIWARYGSTDLVITGGNESGHTTNRDPQKQFHRLPDGTCRAVDLRTWSIPKQTDRHAAVSALADVLGRDFDVLYEKPGQRGEHAHVEYDPK